MQTQSNFRNILCVRADNMGDVIMSSPAIRAFKETFGSHVTLLTSSAGGAIAPYLGCIDDLIIADLPWVKTTGCLDPSLSGVMEEIKNRNFDAAVIFSVYSQSALPAALMLYMAGVPVRAAYARENPYDLLTHWLPDKEPYESILHQVERDMNLAAHLGAYAHDDRLFLETGPVSTHLFYQKLYDLLPDGPGASYFVLHPGVSEKKREYPITHWIDTGKLIARAYNLPILVSGSAGETDLAAEIARGIGEQALCVAGLFKVDEFICLIDNARVVISVNTATIHIAAARQTPAVVLYARTNPQHTPWKSQHEILPFSVDESLKSRNTIIGHVNSKHYAESIPFPTPDMVLKALSRLMRSVDSVQSDVNRPAR